MRHTVLLVVLLTAGCIDPARINTACEWTESPQTLDLTSRRDRAHLREDARVVGELEVRYADTRRKTPAEMEGYVDECRAKLVPVVVAAHHVSANDLARARYARNWPVDFVLVFVPMGLLALLAIHVMVRRLCGMFDAESRKIAAILTALLVPVTAAVLVGITQTWAFTVDGILLNDGHLSFRAFYNPATVHGWIAFFIALAVCGTAALWRFRRTFVAKTVGAYRPALSIRRAPM